MQDRTAGFGYRQPKQRATFHVVGSTHFPSRFRVWHSVYDYNLCIFLPDCAKFTRCPDLNTNCECYKSLRNIRLHCPAVPTSDFVSVFGLLRRMYNRGFGVKFSAGARYLSLIQDRLWCRPSSLSNECRRYFPGDKAAGL